MLRSQFTLTVIAFVIIFIALVLPNRINSMDFSSFLFFPLEILVICAFLLLPARAGLVARFGIASLVAVGTIFKCADMATFKVFARPFNPVFDGYLFINGTNLLNGAIGKVGAALVVVLLVLIVLTIALATFWILGQLQQFLHSALRKSPLMLTASLAGGLMLWLMLFFIGSPKASMQFYQHLATHAVEMRTTVADIKSFGFQLNNTGSPALDPDNLFAQLRGKNVLVIFVESYGRTLLDNPEFAPQIRPLLERTSGALSEKGFAVRSSFLTSPTVGGLSWLAHGTAMSGLWIDNQIRYNSLMISEQPTLNRLFNQAGWRTVAVMPAITMDWPEGNYYGYDHVYDAHNLGYQGNPFNWVTMPDQYTLAAFHERELASLAAPVMAEIALISSHAPWTPIPQLVEWSSVGDGMVFNAQAKSGASPEEVWKDNARIRLQFRLSIEYALETITSYVMNYGDDNLVVLVLGDHQPAPIVTGDNSRSCQDVAATSSRDVPVHLIARDPGVIDAIAHWQWTPGMLPDVNVPVWRMDELRNHFIDAFSLPTTSTRQGE